MDLARITDDLAAEHDALDTVLSRLSEADWGRPTPSPRWSVADQVAHLTYFDGTATVAITDPDAFAPLLDELFTAALQSPQAMDDATLGWARSLTSSELLARWRSGRAELLEAAATLTDGVRVPWYGPSMSAKSFLTARLMETWAHGQDVVDAVGAHRPATDRLEHIARLGVLTRGWTYANRGEEQPAATIRVELTSPSGQVVTWGDVDADEVVTGGLEAFCLVVTQRRHLDDVDLHAEGPAARDWLLKAQAFAGPPTDGPAVR